MSASSAERIVVTAMRLMAAAFGVVGLMFLLAPDGVLRTMSQAGALIASFEPATLTGQPMWVGLAFAYMVVITGLALIVQADVARYRALLLLLAAGKAASSLTAGAFFLLDQQAFILLAGFVVDASLMAVALWCWRLAGRLQLSPYPTTAGWASTGAGVPEPSRPAPGTAPSRPT